MLVKKGALYYWPLSIEALSIKRVPGVVNTLILKAIFQQRKSPKQCFVLDVFASLVNEM